MSIDPNTGGPIQWTPTGTQIGSFPVTVVANNYAGQTSQSFTINVSQSPPTTPTGLTVTGATASSLTLSWNASYDPIGVSSYTVYHFYVTGHSGARRRERLPLRPRPYRQRDEDDRHGHRPGPGDEFLVRG